MKHYIEVELGALRRYAAGTQTFHTGTVTSEHVPYQANDIVVLWSEDADPAWSVARHHGYRVGYIAVEVVPSPRAGGSTRYVMSLLPL